MSATLAALFGDETALVNMGGPDAWKYVIGNMSVITGKELDRDAKHLILEILKGGELIRPITNNTTIIAGMKGVFASVQQSLIGTILAESHVFVEQEVCPIQLTCSDANSPDRCLPIMRDPSHVKG